ncbi:hypothetical protein L7F22_031009 [Adiantum nelumboides]|nr:hypothetical protein [Adiantum nelumboides]
MMGWKDTVTVLPSMMTRIAIKFAMQDGAPFAFDPTGSPGYLWHCHLLELAPSLPNGLALTSPFWLWMITLHTDLFIVLLLGQIGFKGRQHGYRGVAVQVCSERKRAAARCHPFWIFQEACDSAPTPLVVKAKFFSKLAEKKIKEAGGIVVLTT